MKCTAVVEKCHRLDGKLGNLLDREKVAIFAQSIIEVISEYVREDQLEEISEKMSQTLESL